MRRAFAGILIFTATAAPALADDLASCRSIKDNLARLTCYDAAADKSAPSENSPTTPDAAAPTPAKSTWSIEDGKSPVDDSPQVDAMQIATIGQGKTAALMIRCREHRLEVAVAAQEFWGISIGDQRISVLYRVNDTPAVKQDWNPGRGGSALSSSAFYPDKSSVAAFLASLPEHGTFFIRAFDFQGIPHDMTFPLDGIGDVKQRVNAACRLPAGKPTAAPPK